MSEQIFRAQGISKRFGMHAALREVSLELNGGEIFGLLGPNGAGKTTLLRIINRLIPADKGELFFREARMRPEDVSLMGYLPEERGLYHNMSVGSQLVYMARMKGLTKKEAREKVGKWMETLDITPWWNRNPGQLSKGMAQKVQFISALVHDPMLLILDEPFSGFDPVNVELFRNVLRDLRHEGKCILLSTHNMNSVEEICDRIGLIDHSEMVLTGPTREIRQQHGQGDVEVEFEGNMIAFANALWSGFELLENHEVSQGYHYALVRPLRENDLHNLAEHLMPHVRITSIGEKLPSMREVFIQTVTPKDDGQAERDHTA